VPPPKRAKNGQTRFLNNASSTPSRTAAARAEDAGAWGVFGSRPLRPITVESAAVPCGAPFGRPPLVGSQRAAAATTTRRPLTSPKRSGWVAAVGARSARSWGGSMAPVAGGYGAPNASYRHRGMVPRLATAAAAAAPCPPDGGGGRRQRQVAVGADAAWFGRHHRARRRRYNQP